MAKKYTVADFIADLSKLPPDAELFTFSDGGSEQRVVNPDDVLVTISYKPPRVYLRDMRLFRRDLERLSKQVKR